MAYIFREIVGLSTVIIKPPNVWTIIIASLCLNYQQLAGRYIDQRVSSFQSSVSTNIELLDTLKGELQLSWPES